METNTDLPPSDVQEMVAHAQRYSPFLEAIRGEGITKSGLANRLNVTKPTIYNRFSRLADYGLVTRNDGHYRLTSHGRLLADVVAEARTTATKLQRASGFIDNISQAKLPPPSVFRDAKVVTATERPGRPQVTLDRVVRDAERLSGFTPSVHARYLNGTHQTQSDERADEYILQTGTIEYLLSKYADDLREAIHIDGLTLFETDEELPFGLVLVDEPDELLCLSTYTAHGNESGLLINDSAAALEWAWTTYEEYRRGATPLTVEST